MKRKISLLLVLIMILLPSSAFAKANEKREDAKKSPQELFLNGKKSAINGYNIKGYNYFKLRDLAAILIGTEVKMDLEGDNKNITIDTNKSYKKLKDDLKPLSNEVKRALEKDMTVKVISGTKSEFTKIKVFNIGGYNYFKLRDVGELLDFKVSYDEKNNRAIVETGKEKGVSLIDEEKSNPKENNISGRVVLGNERLLTEYSHLIDNKNIGIITNQTGVNYDGKRTVEVLKDYPNTKLVAAYSPEHGLDGVHKAGAYVESYRDNKLNLPVYSLYGKTRKPDTQMLRGIDVLVYDMQDIGSRTYTYISTLNYAMKAAAENNKKIIVLDRPNPLGGEIVEGYLLKDKYKTFVGVDNLPMAHGMTVGELANFFNRNIGCDLTVIPMKNYNRKMIWQDTGLKFVQTSPNITTIESAFNYMATGIGEGTGIGQADKFSWVGGKNVDSKEFAKRLNAYNLPGVKFTAENKGDRGGVKLSITDYHKYNPARTGVYILATANQIRPVNVSVESNGVIPMFEKINGSNEFGKDLKNKKSPEEILNSQKSDVDKFKIEREKYLIYN